jgi:hypothetical protein
MNNNTVLGINLAENDDIGKSFEDWKFVFRFVNKNEYCTLQALSLWQNQVPVDDLA